MLQGSEYDQVTKLADDTGLCAKKRQAISEDTAKIIQHLRMEGKPGLMEQWLAEYGLATEEGVAIMCLAEALLRVPDTDTIDDLIADKITAHDWNEHLGDSASLFVNASTWGLMLSGQVLDDPEDGIVGALQAVIKRVGEPFIREAVKRALHQMGHQFVLGQTIKSAMKRGEAMEARGYTYSYDMLGEGARDLKAAENYLKAYEEAIKKLGKRANKENIRDNPGISVKLSALYPKYHFRHREDAIKQLSSKLLKLCQQARKTKIMLNVDAEEYSRLELSFEIFNKVLKNDSLKGWDGFGIVIQAYQRRALEFIERTYELGKNFGAPINVRLVKGAYWDSEIRHAQLSGTSHYPLFTTKAHSDISYLAAARKLLDMRDTLFPQFATHNAHTIMAVWHMAGKQAVGYEFQRLHGMGEALYEHVRALHEIPCRIYAPVGTHKDLLAYLVRRLLENGANSSFVGQILNRDLTAEKIAVDPLTLIEETSAIKAPPNIYRPHRINAKGYDLSETITLKQLEAEREPFLAPYQWAFNNHSVALTITNPADLGDQPGQICIDDVADISDAISIAHNAKKNWATFAQQQRSQLLLNVADLFESHTGELLALLCREAGKTLDDGLAEIREAVDFLRFYAREALHTEKETDPIGLMICISPWNFPLAIFTGQIAAALSVGNVVIAKPAEQTPLIAARAIQLFHDAGIAKEVLQLKIGDGETIGAELVKSPHINGVSFTGSLAVAKLIEAQLAETSPEAIFIAETGGLNVMLVDTTALIERAIDDILISAFQSAGQRCSALRLLYVQDEIYDELLHNLKAAMDCLIQGKPIRLSSDLGPVIDREAYNNLRAYLKNPPGQIIHQLNQPDQTGYYIPPTLIEVESINALGEEVFGPILHIARYKGEEAEEIIKKINESGYGLTMGLHTRIDERVEFVRQRAKIGNLYVNRNQIGAIVGVQPFGGEGLSGTGPKAGGPNTLSRLVKPQSILKKSAAAINTDKALLNAEIINNAFNSLSENYKPNLTERADLLAEFCPDAKKRVELIKPQSLTSPTGEANTLYYWPRGRVVVFGSRLISVKKMVTNALLAGNYVLLAGDCDPAYWRSISEKLPFKVLRGDIEARALRNISCDTYGLDVRPDEWQSMRQSLAQKEGSICRLIKPYETIRAYCHERVLSVDLAASGGNIELLNLLS